MRWDKNNHDFEICFDKYTGAPNRVYLIETDTQKTSIYNLEYKTKSNTSM